jgi:hypothetical protein
VILHLREHLLHVGEAFSWYALSACSMQLSRGDLVALHGVRFSMEGAHVVDKAAGNPAPPVGLGR